jgi:hypothetical protein
MLDFDLKRLFAKLKYFMLEDLIGFSPKDAKD